jgi:5'-3' exonuclease
MGVPRLAQWIQKRFVRHVRKYFLADKTKSVDYLYLDTNALVHPVTRHAYNIDENRDPTIKIDSTNPKYRKLAFNNLFDRIVEITNIMVPKKVLYIALDGPAPVAKQLQQRQRRHIAARDRPDESTDFDTNAISPGTVFMHELTKFLNYRIRQELNSDKWKDVKVHFSTHTTPGEGEHKIIDFMRSLPESERQNASHVMYGPDGDLFMLTLGIAKIVKKIYLLRDDPNQYAYELYSMGEIAKDMLQYIARSLQLDAVNDFILFGFFVGNDFLPMMRMFYLLEDGMNLMVDSYRQHKITKNGAIDHKAFSAFIQQISKSEEEFLNSQITKTVEDPKLTNTTLLEHVDPKTKKLDYQAYRAAYYKKEGIDVDSNSGTIAIRKMCRAYYHTLEWIFLYYTQGIASWEWHYEYHYPPLMKDLARYTELGIEEEKFSMGKPTLPFVQLLCVLPLKSSHLLPKPLDDLMHRKLSGMGIYPRDFKIDYEGRWKEHMGIALLPFIDLGKVRQEYEIIAKDMQPYVRNTLKKPVVFQRDMKMNARIETEYGTIENLTVKKSECDY